MSASCEVTLCAANSYNKKYYLNPGFEILPDDVKKELQIMCVLFTEDVGGIIQLFFDDEGTLLIRVGHDGADYLFDEIGAQLNVRRMQKEHAETLRQISDFYSVAVLKKMPDK